jgi:hypothetical protein
MISRLEVWRVYTSGVLCRVGTVGVPQPTGVSGKSGTARRRSTATRILKYRFHRPEYQIYMMVYSHSGSSIVSPKDVQIK